MEDNHIEFDTDQQGLSASASQFANQTVFSQSGATGMAAWLIRKGIIKTESQARAVLIGVIMVNFIIAGSVFYFFVIK